MDIYLNGEKTTVTPGRGSKPGAQMSISYELIAEMTGLKGYCPTVTWNAPGKMHGIVSPGERAPLIENMHITAMVTGAA